MTEKWMARKEAGTWYVDADSKYAPHQSFFDVCELFGGGILAEARALLIARAPELQAESSRRLLLLSNYDEGLQQDGDCFFCGIMSFNEDTERWEHHTGCELAKELGDD